MESKPNHGLLAAVFLLVLSGSTATAVAHEPSTTDPKAAVIVTGANSTDRQIRAEVMRRIDEKPALRISKIEVQSSEHKVYLYGTVDSRMEAEEAEAIARTVPGVRNVYSSLGLLGA